MKSFLTIMVLSMAFAVSLHTYVADANDVTKIRAAAHFKKGSDLFEKGDFGSAAQEFEAAYELSPHPRVLFNIAACLDKGGKNAEAVAAYRRYLAETDDHSDLGSIRARLSELETKVSGLRIGCPTEGCEIRINGTGYGQAPVSVILEPGGYEIEASADEHVTERVTVHLNPGQNKSMTLEPSSPEPLPIDEPPASQDRLKLGWPFLWASGTTITAATIMAGFAISTHQKEKEFIEKGRTNEKLAEEGRRDKIFTNVFIAVTAVAAATSIAFLIYDLKVSRDKLRKPSAARLRITPLGYPGALATVEF